MTPKLTIALSTMHAGYRDFTLPDSSPGISWIVVVQMPEGDPVSHFSNRQDVDVLTAFETGLSRSRNMAAQHAKTPWVLLCDDDISIDPKAALSLVVRAEVLSATSGPVGFVWGRLRRHDGDWMARYPLDGTQLFLRNARSVQSASLLISGEALRRSGVTFDERFGLGSSLPIGEEYILVTDLVKHGWRGFHADITVGTHPADSTGSIWGDPKVLRGRAAVLGRVFGPLAPVLRARYAWAHRHKFGSLVAVLRFTLGPRFL